MTGASSPRRSTDEDATSRHALLDAAEQLLLEDGYAAVTARRVAAKAGVSPQLVHYYFASMDDLFISIIRRGATRSAAMIEQALASPKPLRALWRLSTHPAVTTLSADLYAASRHRKAIRKDLADAAQRFRLAQADAISTVLERYNVDTGQLSVGVALLLLESLARVIVTEESVGMTTFHDEARVFIEDQLSRLEGEPNPPVPPR